MMAERAPFSPIPLGALLAIGLAALLLTACDETTVTALEVATVEVTPAGIQLVQGEAVTVSATPRDGSGRALVGRSVTWSSNDPAVAEVDQEGRVLGLQPGSARIRATTDGVTGETDVEVLPGPSIQLDPSEVGLVATAGSDEPTDATVEVSNGGAGTLSGLEVEVEDLSGSPAPWLTAALSASSAPTLLTLSASAAELAPREYEARVRITSPVALNSPVEVAVTLTVAEPPPFLAVEPGSLSLSARSGALQPATHEFDVTNAGGGTLDGLEATVRAYSDGADGWLSVALQDTQAPTTVSLAASARSLPPGEYSAIVRISSPVAANEFVDVPVTFTVGGGDL
jgi:uncharacterized protein (DUF58 family)